jgi:predicted DNA-binding transcriptional regulator AlpA
MTRNIPKFSVEEKRAFQVNETVAAYGYTRSTLYKLINSCMLRTIKIGKRRLIPTDAAGALLREGA